MSINRGLVESIMEYHKQGSSIKLKKRKREKKKKLGTLFGLIWKNCQKILAHWIRIRLPVQGTWVRSLVWEDSTCHRVTKPVCPEPVLCNREPITVRSPSSTTRQ